ncbi:MAG: amidase [Deltaproteobacteria bacterium]|nr:amidase [Deltaproteobacteria bacterium]
MSATFHPLRAADYRAAYLEGRTTPSAVAESLLKASRAAKSRNPSMSLFITQYGAEVRALAAASTERYAQGGSLGPLDGVPVSVKDEIDQEGYPTTVGTSFLGKAPALCDAEVVARLRASGALLCGKANMQEIGLGVTGINPHHGAARNPYDARRMTGGSSSGSGAMVGAGLCPLSIGADGGGSIRIPAALCGVVGLKPTFGRVSEHGAAPLCWSLAHLGPIGATVQDVATALEVIAGPDAADPNTLGQPELGKPALGAERRGVEGLRIGWSDTWASKAEPELRTLCFAAVETLVQAGARRVEVDLQDLDLMAPVQYVTIGVEMAASQHEWRRDHMRDYAADTRLLLEMASRVSGVDYVRAQRFRTLISQRFAGVFEEVDVLATPMTAITAPMIPKGAEKSGLSDDAVLEGITAFSFAANLTGLPALTLPVGYDVSGLPVGLQLMGKHWQEALLLEVGAVLEAGIKRRAPAIHFDVLGAALIS